MGGQEPVSMATLARFWRRRPWNAHPMCSNASRGRTEEGGGPGGPAGLPPPHPILPHGCRLPHSRAIQRKRNPVFTARRDTTSSLKVVGVGEGGCILTHFLCGGDLHILSGTNYKLQTPEEPRRNRPCSPDEDPTLLLASCKTEFQTPQANS